MFGACGGKKAQVAMPSIPPTPPPAVSAAVPATDNELQGLASYYAEPYHGRRTANGEVFDSYREMTAAHRTLPFNTLVRVTNANNGQSVDVRINDRGPFVDGRVIDLSLIAAQRIDMVRAGVVPVKLQILKAGDGARLAADSNRVGQPLYAVQVGAFENLRNAEDLKRRLERKYSGVSVQTFSGQTTIYRVRIGRESDLSSAQKLAVELQKEDLQPFVVRVN